METSQSISNQHNVKQQCEERSFGLLSLSVFLQDYLQLVTLLQFVRRGVHAGQVAFLEYIKDRRKLVGLGFGVAGVCSIGLHTIFFMQYEKSRDYGWYYINAFYFAEAIRFWIALILLSVSFFLHVPVKYKSIWVVFGLVSAIGVCGLIHYSFFVNSFETFNSFPVWWVGVLSLALGAGFIKAIDYLCYRKYHLKDGTTCRIIGVIEMDMQWDKKEQMLKELAQEYRDLNARI
jgi:hypothetical protein